MKKNSFILLLCFVFFQSKAQTIQVPSFTTATNTTMTITLSTLNFGAIIGLEGGLYSGNGVEFLSVGSSVLTNIGAGINIINPNQIAIAWIEPSFTPINLPDGTPIFQIQIRTTSGNGTITFGNNPINNAPVSAIDQNFNPINITSSNGTYIIQGDPLPTQNSIPQNAPIDSGVGILLLIGLLYGGYKLK